MAGGRKVAGTAGGRRVASARRGCAARASGAPGDCAKLPGGLRHSRRLWRGLELRAETGTGTWRGPRHWLWGPVRKPRAEPAPPGAPGAAAARPAPPEARPALRFPPGQACRARMGVPLACGLRCAPDAPLVSPQGTDCGCSGTRRRRRRSTCPSPTAARCPPSPRPCTYS